jgi:hypothetical protein
MARGWESKSVQGQVDEFQARAAGNQKLKVTPEEAEIARRTQVLTLACGRVRRDLQASQNPRHREQLASALVHLEAQLADLSPPPSPDSQ